MKNLGIMVIYNIACLTKSMRYFNTIPLLLIIISFIAEGLSFSFSRTLSYHLSLTAGLVALLNLFIYKQKKIELPVPVLVALVVFVGASAISTLLAKHIPLAFEYIVWQIVSLVIFVHSFNTKEKTLLLYYGYLSAIVLFIVFFINFDNRFFSFIWHYPETGFNFFYRFHEDHNHLSDTLSYLFIGVLYFALRNKKKRPLILFILSIILIFIFITGSRTALFVVGTVSVFMGIRHYKNKLHSFYLKNKMLFWKTMAFPTIGIFIFSALNLQTTITFIQKILNGRDNLFNQGFMSIFHFPWFGVGPGNFFVSSLRFGWEPFEWSYMSTNMLLDIFVENGIFAGVAFLMFLLFYFKNADTKKPEFYIVLAMLISFQTDYLYRFYSLGMLFFFLLGSTLNVEKIRKLIIPQWIFILLFLLFFLIQQSLLLSSVINQKHVYQTSLLMYPLQEKPYEYLIENKIGNENYTEAQMLIKKYERLFNGSAYHLKKVGDYYKSIK
jgi:O-antigen ligase